MKLELFDTPLGRFLLNPQDNISRHLIEGKFWEPELKPIFDALPDGSRVVEVGAYIGDHTVYLSQRHKVFAIEGFRENYLQLCANIILNESSADPICKVAGDGTPYRAAESVDGYPVDLENNASGARVVRDYWGSVSTRIDTLAHDFGRVDLLKIDCEGMDLEVLRGSMGLISKMRPRIIYEININIDSRENQYRDLFQSIDYNNDQIGQYNWLATPK